MGKGARTTHEWQQGTPKPGRVVEVWYRVGVILATWDGQAWQTPEGDTLKGVAWWRER